MSSGLRNVLLALLVCTLVLAPFGAASAAPKGEQAKKLALADGSDYAFDEVTAELVDGKWQVNGKMSGSTETKIHVRVTVDLEKGTYKTETLAMPETEVPGKPEASVSSDLGVLGSYYYFDAKLVTEDPAQVDLCWTENRLVWYVTDGGVVTATSYLLNAWAGNPTTLGTHWYVDSTNEPPPSYDYNYTTVYHTTSANFHNDDFMDDSLRTWAYHYMRVSAYNNGTFDLQWNYSHTGEFYYLLQIDLYVNGQQWG